MEVFPVGDKVLIEEVEGREKGGILLLDGAGAEVKLFRYYVREIGPSVEGYEVGDEVVLAQTPCFSSVQGMKGFMLVPASDIWGRVTRSE